MITRARARKAIESTYEQSDKDEMSLKKYIHTIENLKLKLAEKDKLNNVLIDEQENNAIEFENICKQINLLKKKFCEEELKNSELQHNINILTKENAELIKERETCEDIVNIRGLQKTLDLKKFEYRELHQKYSELLLKSVNSNALTKGFNMKKIRNKRKRTIKSRHLKYTCTISRLLETRRILEIELERRNCTVQDLNRESEKLLEIIFKHEEDLKTQSVTLGKLSYLENRLRLLQDMIERRNTGERNLDLEVKESYTNTNGIEAKIPSIVGCSLDNNDNLEKINLYEGKLEMADSVDHISPGPASSRLFSRKNIRIFSDGFGAGLGSLLSRQTSDKVINTCSPGSSFKRLSKLLYDSAVNHVHSGENDSVLVLIAGGKCEVTRNDVKESFRYLNEISSKNRIIIYTLPYGTNSTNNNHLYVINTDIYNLSCHNGNIHVIDSNECKKMSPLSKIETLFDLLYCNIYTPLTKKSSTVIEIVTLTNNYVHDNVANTADSVKDDSFLGVGQPLRVSR